MTQAVLVYWWGYFVSAAKKSGKRKNNVGDNVGTVYANEVNVVCIGLILVVLNIDHVKSE